METWVDLFEALKPEQKKILNNYSKQKTGQDFCMLTSEKQTELWNLAEKIFFDRELDLEEKIKRAFSEIGIPLHIKGYRYVKSAVLLCVRDISYIDSVTKRLYPEVAKEYETTTSRVERAIRHAIQVAWERGDQEVIFEYFGNTVSCQRGNPTNSEFIATISQKIK